MSLIVLLPTVNAVLFAIAFFGVVVKSNYYFAWIFPALFISVCFVIFKKCPGCSKRWYRYVPKVFKESMTPQYVCPTCGYEVKPKSTVKLILKYNKWIMSGAFVLMLSTIFLNGPQISESYFLDQAEVTVQKFHECWKPGEYQTCQYAAAGLKGLGDPALISNELKIRSLIGDRVSAVIDASTLKFFISKSIFGKSMPSRLEFSAKGVYQKKENVTEVYILLFSDELNHYQVDSLMFNF